MTYVDLLKSDTGASTTGELAVLMNDRCLETNWEFSTAVEEVKYGLQLIFFNVPGPYIGAVIG